MYAPTVFNNVVSIFFPFYFVQKFEEDETISSQKRGKQKKVGRNRELKLLFTLQCSLTFHIQLKGDLVICCNIALLHLCLHCRRLKLSLEDAKLLLRPATNSQTSIAQVRIRLAPILGANFSKLLRLIIHVWMLPVRTSLTSALACTRK